MTNQEKWKRLSAILDEAEAYGRAIGKLSFDMECCAPEEGMEQAGDDMALLGKHIHALMHSPEYAALVEERPARIGVVLARRPGRRAELRMPERPFGLALDLGANGHERLAPRPRHRLREIPQRPFGLRRVDLDLDVHGSTPSGTGGISHGPGSLPFTQRT